MKLFSKRLYSVAGVGDNDDSSNTTKRLYAKTIGGQMSILSFFSVHVTLLCVRAHRLCSNKERRKPTLHPTRQADWHTPHTVRKRTYRHYEKLVGPFGSKAVSLQPRTFFGLHKQKERKSKQFLNDFLAPISTILEIRWSHSEHVRVLRWKQYLYLVSVLLNKAFVDVPWSEKLWMNTVQGVLSRVLEIRFLKT